MHHLQLAKRLEIKLLEINEDITEKPEVNMVEALTKLSSMGGIKNIPNPVGWQKKIRKDRKQTGTRYTKHG